MKIIIKGDRNVGKSCLLERLQGKGFVESYTPTEEIQVASIQWSFKATEDIVKVEVWDVVDRGKARQRNSGLKLSMGGLGSPEQPALDAEFLDVYKGTHGVVLMLDVTKAWTFEYVIKEISKVPTEIPILIFGNHCDMGHHRVVTSGQVDGLIEGLSRIGEVIYGESSMRNGFGLRLLHKFLGLPFLKLQKESLLALIERNKRDTQICSFEVSEFLKSDDSDYNKFLDNLSNKRRQVADSNPKALSHSPSNTSINSNSGIQSEFRPTKSIIVGGGQPIVIPGQLNITNDPKFRAQQNLPSLPNKNSNSSSSGLISNLLGRIDIKEAIPDTINYSVAESKVVSVEEFCPDGGGGLDRSFLDDLPSTTNSHQNMEVIDSDSDNEGGNPMVASFHEEPEEEIDQIIISRTEEIKPKINPLLKNSKVKTERKPSFTSSEDIPIVINKIDENNEISSEDLDSWLGDSNVRRSPEGGEDLSLNQRMNQEPIAVEIVVSEEKLEKKKKKKKEKKEKRDKDEKSSKEKKKKKKSKENDLEDFLNGSPNSENHVAEEYDSI